MKSSFTPNEFLTMVNSLTEVIKVLAQSEQYHELSNSVSYFESTAPNLIQVIEGLESVSDNWIHLHRDELDYF